MQPITIKDDEGNTIGVYATREAAFGRIVESSHFSLEDLCDRLGLTIEEGNAS